MAEAELPSVSVRFYAELNDHLPREDRQRERPFRFVGRNTAKDAIEAFGVPHVEVDLIVVNGRSVDFAYRLRDGDRISVYPVFESLDLSPLVRLQDRPLRNPCFVADVHLRKLARWLRLLGFDTAYSDTATDAALAASCGTGGRILLTRDRELLKRRAVTHGYWVRNTDPVEQTIEVMRRFDLAGNSARYTRCATCNEAIIAVDKADVATLIPPRTAAWLDEYFRCTGCGKLYWRGTHVPKIDAVIDHILERCATGESRSSGCSDR